MPKTNINYANIIMYKIVCKDLNITEIYVGSTSNFRIRKNSHKSRCCDENNVKHNMKIYTKIRLNGGWDNWEMLEIEKYPCNDGNEAHAREKVLILQLNSKLNTVIPQNDRHDYIKLYLEINKEKIAEKRKIKVICSCGAIIQHGNKTHHEKTQKHINYINTLTTINNI